jgi:beta-glucosidase/6-phospho-beta-glucosidase/beta-galactosidase
MSLAQGLELWGGLECSVVRVGDDIRNQITETGHYERAGDLHLVAELGVETLRYPILWETVSLSPDHDDWRWHDARLGQLHKLGISPIAGLVHHGSGPPWCDVLHPDFPAALARHAAAVAQRYPWITMFTPVNEPMTTARLCGLYGHWHPHGRDEATCFLVVVAECLAIAAAMRAIRRVNSSAKLIQTEDVGRVFATPLLQYQADHENERRWLALDLLAGRVDWRHPFHQRLLDHGIDERHLDWLAGNPCPPDMIGIDQYLTSDRFLDEDAKKHPGVMPGGNHWHSYVDVAAARVGVPARESGFLPRIIEAWERYGIPLSLTEVHNGSTREEQLRWLMAAWHAANAARASGIELRAVSVWSLFGATDWNSLLARREGFYESGAFDIRFSPPRPTGIAAFIRGLRHSGSFDHPALDRPGWWKADEPQAIMPPRPILLTGSDALAQTVVGCCESRRLDVVEGERQPAYAGYRPWARVEAESGFEGAKSHSGKSGPVLRLSCHYIPPGERMTSLVVEAAHTFDPVHVVNAFLDLVIDGATGRFRMTRADPWGQYSFEPDNCGDNATVDLRRAV